ncbi:hypothetical protein JCM17380_08930 [Desulfosporosinus burensis]
MSKLTKSTVNILIALVFLCLAIYMYTETSHYPAPPEGMLGPAFFPRFIALTMGILALTLLAISVITKDKSRANLTEDIDGKKSLIFIIGMVLYVALLEPLGFIISSFIFMSFLVMLMQNFAKQALLKSITLSLVCVSAVYYLFGEVFEVALPTGILSTWF